jgi:hypothetical protein
LILGRVRRKLHAIGIQDFTDTDIYDEMQEAQKEIIAQTKCYEKAIYLSTSANQSKYHLSELLVDYDFLQDGILIKDIIVPSTYDNPIEIKRNNEWQDIIMQDGSIQDDSCLATQPLFMTIFGDSLYLYPAPANDGDEIILWSYLLNSIKNVSATNELEIQSYFDKAIEYFVISQFSEELSKKYYPMFLDEINKYKELPAMKSTGIKVMETHW